MNKIITSLYKDGFEVGQPFWQAYDRLWHESQGRSPFQAPQFLQYLASRAEGLVAVQGIRDGVPIAVAVFKKDSGRYSFLSDMKTDANFFILHRSCTSAEARQFFNQFLRLVKEENWALTLNNQPAWAGYMDQLEAAGQASGLFWLNLPYSVCPVAEAETPEALFGRVNGSRELRYRVNKLKKQENAEFEAIAGGADLEQWVEEFCEAHVLRWANTPTPSSYRDPGRRQFLLQCLQAWNADQLLVRFSVKVQQRRVGFVIGLLEENSLIHHSTTFHPDYWKFSPGKALIHFMTQWMQENNMRVLDFGDGNETYKYDVANKEHALHRIFISSPTNLPFILKTKAIQAVRDNPKMYSLYRDKLKRLTQRLQL